MNVYNVKWCNENVNGNPLTWTTFKGEFKEFLIEVLKFNKEGIREEFYDSLYAFNCALHTSTKGKINLPVPSVSVNKILKRFEVWKEIFDKHDLTFNKEYLRYGANYNKQHKVEKALELARLDQQGDD